MKKTYVELTNGELKVTRKFEISQAERLLRMPNNAGWELPKNSNYTFTEEDGIIRRHNKAADSAAE